MTSPGASLALIALVSSTPLALAQDRSEAWAATTVVRTADLDRTDDVSPEEWQAFLESLHPAADGTVDPQTIKARVFERSVDRTEDGRLTIEDVLTVVHWLDADGDEAISAAELAPGAGGGNRARWGNLFAANILKRPMDADASGDLSADEVATFIDGLAVDTQGIIQDESILVWVRMAEEDASTTPSGGFTPGSYLKSVESALDPDGDGKTTVDDLQMLFDRTDRDGNGALTQDEIGFGRGGRGGSGGAQDGRTAGTEPLMPWQRTLEDALALVKATGKPLLICVNMDDEMASESLARSRYRDPRFVELAKGFIPVLASPNKRNTRDHDDHGRRIVDAKFGRLIDSEHIDIEPALYERYFGGQRVAPRHVGVDADGNILFDIFLVNDLRAVDDALRKYGKPDAPDPEPDITEERDLLASPAAAHRMRLEQRFMNGDERTRARLANLALSAVRSTQHPEILRMGLRDESETVRTEAVWTVVRQSARVPLELFPEAFRACKGSQAPSQALIEALASIAGQDPDGDRGHRAREMERVFASLSRTSRLLDVERWRVALSWAGDAADVPPDQSAELGRRLSELEALLKEAPEDRDLNLAFAAVSMRYALVQIREGRNPSFMLEDVLASAAKATSSELPDGRAIAYMAWASYLLNDIDAARERAMQAAPLMVPWAGTPLAAKVLEIVADTRVRDVYGAMGTDGRDWETDWVVDARAAYEILAEHPSGTVDDIVSYVDFLNALGATGRQEDILIRGLRRYPLSGRLHAYLRSQMVEDYGAAALEATYASFTPEPEDVASFEWYEALAHLVAAERYVLNRENDRALASYDRSAEMFQASVTAQPDFEESASHYLCFAYAGAARLHAGAEQWQEAIQDVRSSVAANPASFTKEDGLGKKPSETAGDIVKALKASGHTTEAQSLSDYLAQEGLAVEG